jgi:hypothetical protein
MFSLLRFSFAYKERWLRAAFGCPSTVEEIRGGAKESSLISLMVSWHLSFPQNQQTQSNINQAIAVDLQLPLSNIGHFLQFSS